MDMILATVENVTSDCKRLESDDKMRTKGKCEINDRRTRDICMKADWYTRHITRKKEEEEEEEAIAEEQFKTNMYNKIHLDRAHQTPAEKLI